MGNPTLIVESNLFAS